MKFPRSPPVISPVRPLSISVNRAPHRSNTIASDGPAICAGDQNYELGWPDDRIIVIDEDLGLSGSGAVTRLGFARLTAEVALGHVGLVLGLEVSRLARNNADWHRLIDLAGLSDTLIGDADGLIHPALFNDRLLLGLKGTMSEAELHVLRARLNGGIRNKAARGELRRGLPFGFLWGDADGEVRFHPDEAVVTAIRAVFAKFAETGSVRRVWLWLRSEGLSLPLQMHQEFEIRWGDASYTAIHHVLTNPVYAGAYAYGKTRTETMLDAAGGRRKRIRHLTPSERQVLIPEHHPGFIDWQTYEANQARIAQNTHPGATQGGGRRRGKVRPCCRASPAAAIADVACARTTAGVIRQRAIIAPARSLSKAAASIVSMWAAFRLTTPSHGPSSPPSNRRSSQPVSPPPPPKGSKQIARPCSNNGASASNERATKRGAPSADTVLWIPIIGWLLANSSASGRRA